MNRSSLCRERGAQRITNARNFLLNNIIADYFNWLHSSQIHRSGLTKKRKYASGPCARSTICRIVSLQ